MLSKAISLNLKIGKDDFSKAIGISAAGYALASLAGGIPLAISLIIVTVFCIKGLNCIFSTSLFDNQGTFYMALPLSEKEIVLSKVAAGSIYMLLLDLVSVSAIFAITILSYLIGLDVTEILMSPLQQYMDLHMTAGQIAVLMGLSPLKMLLQQVFFCSFAMAALLSFNLIKPGKLSVVAWLVIFGINAAVSSGITAVTGKLVGAGFNIFLLEGLTDGFYIVVIVGLFTYCVKALNSKFNM